MKVRSEEAKRTLTLVMNRFPDVGKLEFAALTMSFKSLRDKMQWVALGLALVLFALDWITRTHYVAFVNSQYVDSTPRVLNQLWLVLLPATLIAAILSFPRAPSFLALLSFLWVMFLAVQGQ